MKYTLDSGNEFEYDTKEPTMVLPSMSKAIMSMEPINNRNKNLSGSPYPKRTNEL